LIGLRSAVTMFNRGNVLTATIELGVLARTGISPGKAAQPATPVAFDVPPGACDCHTHIHGDPATFPFFPGRVYTPQTALPEEMLSLHRALYVQSVVIVTPSVYGTDNSATLYGMKARGRDARGVAVIDEKTSERELDALNAAGIRGVRINRARREKAIPRSAGSDCNRHPASSKYLHRNKMFGSGREGS
jgi:predicted TIM-barrel fold metal-dependent hydrolase